MLRPHTFLLFLLLFAPAALANTVGRELLIPIAGRAAGAFGSFWLTDLVVSNVAESGEPVLVGLMFVNRAENVFSASAVTLIPGQTAVLRDVIDSAFHRGTVRGLIRVAATTEDARITAHARIYNINNAAGEFGQIVPGIPVMELSRNTMLAGLSGIFGNRTNIGIANVDDTQDAVVSLTLLDAEGAVRGTTTATVRQSSVVQINDVFTAFGVAPFESAAVRVASSLPVYSYASVVRNDSGDGDFIAGAASDRVAADIVIAPACASPAEIALSLLPAPGFFFRLHQQFSVTTKLPELEAKYGFKAVAAYDFINAFHAIVTPQTLAALRCDASIDYASQNGYASGGGH